MDVSRETPDVTTKPTCYDLTGIPVRVAQFRGLNRASFSLWFKGINFLWIKGRPRVSWHEASCVNVNIETPTHIQSHNQLVLRSVWRSASENWSFAIGCFMRSICSISVSANLKSDFYTHSGFSAPRSATVRLCPSYVCNDNNTNNTINCCVG